MENIRLSMERLTKTFPGVKALDNAKLKVKSGSVHALIGENGAGKSTLMKCLFGLYTPDSGDIQIDGKEVKISGTLEALNQGIIMIHQELNFIPNRTVSDNIWMGRYEKKGIVVDDKKMHIKTKKLMDMLQLDISPETMAKDLSVSQLQSIEIAKAVSYDAKIIVMDEPTSSLTTGETEKLFEIIRRLRSEGRSIIYISHKMEEISELADEVTVMRDGKYIGIWKMSEVTIDSLIEKMVGRSMDERFPPPEGTCGKNIMLRVENLASAEPRSFKNISFDLHEGEILGIGGLVGAKRTELIESIFGLRPLAQGVIYKKGEVIENKNPHQAIENGFALLTEERRATGIFPMHSVTDNSLIVAYPRYSSYLLKVIKKKSANKAASQVWDKMRVVTSSPQTPIANLSGGNQQKVLVGRWLLSQSNILMLDEPTRGVDIGAKYEIYKIMRELVRQGTSIIMVSSEMPELLGVSDRVMVMCDGRLTGVLEGDDASQVEVMNLATKFSKDKV